MFLLKLKSILTLFNRKFFLLKIALILSVIGLILIPLFSSEHTLVTRSTNWSVSGKFTIDGTYPSNKSKIESVLSHDENIVLWGSWTGNDKQTGKLISPAFRAPTILSMFVAGYPNASGNELFLERINDRQQLKLKVIDPQESWTDIKWLLPSSWHNTTIRLVAVDGATAVGGWLGVSSPRQANWFSLISSQLPSLVIFPLYIVHFCLFLVPGIFIAIFLVQRNYISRVFTLIMSITISSLIGYGEFWIYFLNHNIGKITSILLMATSFLYLIKYLKQRKNTLQKILFADVSIPLLLMFLVGIFYISILYGVDSSFSEATAEISQVRFLSWQLPPDNIIPYLFANRLYTNQDPRSLIGDWLSSDRPPLQTGLVLVQYPLMALTGLGIELHYQILSTIIQCSWVASVWALCRTSHLSGRKISIVMTFSIFSGFFLLNSVYVWPKLIAGSLAVFTFTLLLQSILVLRNPSTIQITLAAVATALSMLAHGGVIFTLPAVALVIIVRSRYFPGIRPILIGFSIFVLLLAPWSLYQKFYNPPGDRLVKWHIGGVTQIDKRSSLQVIIDSYQNSTLQKIANNKWENLKMLVGQSTTEIKSPDVIRGNEFFHLFKAMSILNIGWLILLINIFFKRLFTRNEGRVVKLIFEVSLTSLLFWVLVMFGPYTTSIHQGSYATMILLFTGLGIAIASIPGWLPYFFLGIQILAFTVTWVVTTPPVLPNTIMFIPNIPMIVSAIIAFLLLFMTLHNLLHRVHSIDY